MQFIGHKRKSTSRLVQDEDSLETEMRKDATGSFPCRNHHRFNSSSVFLHTYEHQRKQYAETKCGGHILDHKRMIQTAPKPQTSLRTCINNSRDRRTQQQYDLYRYQVPKQQDYASIKVGGHALDHVRFLGKGIPSRRLLIVPPVASSCGCCRRQNSSIRFNCQHQYCFDCSSRMEVHLAVNDVGIKCPECHDFVPFLTDIASTDSEKIRVLLSRKHHSNELMGCDATHHRRTSVSQLLTLLGAGFIAKGFHQRIMSLVRSIPKEEPAADEPTSLLVRPYKDMNDQIGWNKRIAFLEPPSKLLRYKYVRTLGKGSFADVFLVERGDRYCVLKESDKLEAAVNEMNALNRVNNPNVVHIEDFFMERIGHKMLAYIEMEYCDCGDLKSLIERSGPLEPERVKSILEQLMNGLASLHAQKIVHRDLKPANILFSKTNGVKIADLGVSTDLGSRSYTQNAVGTLAFMAPEIRKYFAGGGSIQYDTRADIWSLGAVALAMVTGNSEPNILSRPLEEVMESVNQYLKDDTKQIAKLIGQSLVRDPENRAPLSQLTRVLTRNSKI